MTYRLYGTEGAPEDWAVLPPGYTINGSMLVQMPGFFVKEFETYKDCRKWVLAELTARRKILGKCMEKWFHIPEEIKDEQARA